MREGPALEGPRERGTVGEATAAVADGDGDGEDEALEGSCTSVNDIDFYKYLLWSKIMYLQRSEGIMSPKLATARMLRSVIANIAP